MRLNESCMAIMHISSYINVKRYNSPMGSTMRSRSEYSQLPPANAVAVLMPTPMNAVTKLRAMNDATGMSI